MNTVDEVLPLHAELPLLRIESGAVKVGNTRITLDLIVEQYDNGMTPEDMVRAYDTLQLVDVYAAISYFLRHQNEVREYMKKREIEAAALQAFFEARRPPITRAELLARREAMDKNSAPTTQ